MGQKNGRHSNGHLNGEDVDGNLEQPTQAEPVQETFSATETPQQHSTSSKPIPKKKSKHKEETMKKSPRASSKEKSVEIENPVTPTIIGERKSQPHATSTPVTNGVYVTESTPSNLSGIDSGSGTEDETDDEDYNAEQQDNKSLDRKPEINFGRFYNKSYLKDNEDKGYLKRSSQNLIEKKSTIPSFIKPANFSYSQDKPEFLKTKKGSGMMALASTKRVVKVHHKPTACDLKNEEAVKLSMYPAGKPREANEPEKIERDDWPGPASPAALLPEILRERRRSRGEEDEEDEEGLLVINDPKIKRELEEMTKLKDKSGIGSVIYKELEERKALPVQPLNPWKSSRVPSAKYEPRYCTRYQSPMFASPSRFLDYTRRSWDDCDIRGYRSLTTLANLPIPKPGYGPSYGLTPRATTLPLSGAYGARDDYYHLDFEDRDQERPDLSVPDHARNEGRVQEFVEGPSISVLKLQKSTWHTEAEPRVYDYERLKVTNFDLPKDVDRDMLEIHLSDEDFDNLIKMPRDKFFKLAEWKRNDIKKKLDLY
ncbi:hypothetical protein LOTGIDRAFT_234877 [Lottia gigantea]|uniref:HP domain-containing protein n=1 Tax=Lottia gigantea TaxID=225164 RepID=V3ZZ43_LOTGI|nr:hypothetical protein LOTGIDRAFT_234877 [Lottia gigantea]ESO87890.1 hypothetical protein LOTGIDRAFT_234877 [Lottia gigantea]